MADVDVTPDGDPIDVRTWWLPLPSGAEYPMTIDFTAFNAAMKELRERLETLKEETRDDD